MEDRREVDTLPKEDKDEPMFKQMSSYIRAEMAKQGLTVGDLNWVIFELKEQILRDIPIKETKVLSDKYQKLIVETEDTKEILAEITADDIKSANNIQVRLTPTYDD